MHELNNMEVLETILTKNIVNYKLKIVEFFKDQVPIIHRVAINPKYSYVKIETRELLPEDFLNNFLDEFDLTLYLHKKVATETNELYYYAFRPPTRLSREYWFEHKDDPKIITEIIG